MSRTTLSRIARRGVTAIAAGVLGLSTLALATPAHADPVAPVGVGTNQEIRNQQNTLCLDDFNFDTTPGAEVRQWTCSEAIVQLWQVTDLGNGYAEIRNKNSNLCLDDYNFGTAPGSEVRQWDCWGGDVQQWKLTDVGGGWTEIRNKYNDLCLESEAAPIDGTLVSQQTCTGAGVQRWRLTDPNVAKVTWELQRVDNPNEDELDAYARITEAMDKAVARWNKFDNTQRHLTIAYNPGVPTAEAWGASGFIQFGSSRHYMQEGFALHEMNHAFGTGTSSAWGDLCDNQNFPAALPLLRSWDGPDAKIHCGSGGIHFAPYGLNYADEFSEVAFDRNVRLVQAMHHDGV